MEHLEQKVASKGKSIPDGLKHVLLHHGKTRKDVYRYMYGQLVYGGKLATPGSTLIYPQEIRQLVRERFADDASGAYDHQYDEPGAGTHLSLEDVVDFQWRKPPASCVACMSKP